MPRQGTRVLNFAGDYSTTGNRCKMLTRNADAIFSEK